MKTLKKNWPLFACTVALILTPTWLAGQSRSDPLGLRKGECNGPEIMDSIQTLTRSVNITGLQIDTLQKSVDRLQETVERKH